MLKHLIPLALAVALAGCQALTPADVANRVIKGGMVAAQGLFISEADEIRIGQETTAKVLAQMPEYPNPTVRDYVNRIGQQMVAHSERKTLTYQFRVVQSSEVNAFAAPGGFIFVTTGALRLMKNEAQLAGVLGHEVGHVAKQHSINSIRQTMLAQGVATAVLDGNNNQLIQTAANVGANLILKGFDRGAELESDQLGATYAYAAGYDPRELGTFLDALRQGSGEMPPWLVATSDHPRTDDRLTKLSEYMTLKGMQPATMKLGEAEYKANVTANLSATDPSPVPAASATPAPAQSIPPGYSGMP